MDIRNFFKGGGGGAKKKKKKKAEADVIHGDDGDESSKAKAKAVSADDFYAAMRKKDTKKNSSPKKQRNVPPPASPEPVSSSPRKVTPKPTPEKQDNDEKNEKESPTVRQSPRKRAATPKSPDAKKKTKSSIPQRATPEKRATPPSTAAKSPLRKKQKASPVSIATKTKSKASATKSKKLLEPTETREVFDVDAAVPECLQGRAFVFSGVLPNLDRETAQEMVKELGGRTTTAVSSKTDYLVVGEILEDGRAYTEGSKYKKAVALKKHVVVGEAALYGLFQQYHEYHTGTKQQKNGTSGAAGAPTATSTPSPKTTNTTASTSGSSNKKPVAVNPYAKKPIANPYAKPSNPYASANKPRPAAAPSSSSPPKPVARPPASNNPNTLWVDRYKPTSAREILGNAESVRKLTSWLQTWERKFNTAANVGKSFSNPNGPFKAALLSGPPGIGKTTTATIVAREAGRDLIEFNASDVRSKKALKENFGDITGSNTLEFGGAASKKQNGSARKKRCIIMDEVDGMGAGDRSGMAELIQLIKHSRVPIICICNDRQSQKMKSLVPYCMDLRYRRPTKTVIAKRAMAIAQQEGLTVEQNAAEAIAESCGNDVRQVLNCMQMWASNNQQKTTHMTYKSVKERESSINKDEILRVSLFDAAKTILEGRRGLQSNATPELERSHFFRRNDRFFVDYNFVGLIVQQNYLKVAQGSFLEAKRSNDTDKMQASLESMSQAADGMSDLAIAEHSLRGEQNWSLLPLCGVLTVKTGFHAGGPNGGMLPGFPEFTTWLGRNSTKGKRTRLLGELNHHMNYKISGGPQEMRMSYIPVLRERFLSMLSSLSSSTVADKNVGIAEAIELMDEYGLNRDDIFEKLEEFGIGPKTASFSKIDSKTKSAFTRTYNSGSHKSQALVAEQGGGGKKKRGGAAPATTTDPDVIDEDGGDIEEEPPEEEEVEKLKELFKKKGRKKAAKKKTTAKKKK